MSQFKNIYPYEEHTWVVAIGSLPDFYVDPKGLELSWRGEGKGLENPILTSELRVTCRCDETHTDYITTIGTMVTTGITVTVYKDGDFWWGGIMQHEAVQLQYDSGAGYWFDVAATDGLALLKEKDFDNAGAQYEGTDSILGHVATCLKKLPHVEGMWSGEETPFIKSAVGWLAVQHAGSTDNPVQHTWINRRVWYDYDSKGNIKNTSCWDVLKNVLGILGARIFQIEGFWFIEQPLVRNETTFPGYSYDYDLAASSATLNGERSIQCESDSQRVAPGGHYDWLPALRTAKFTWKARQRRNWLPGYNRKDTDASTNYMGDTLDHSSGKVSLRFTAKVRVELVNGGYVGFDSVWVKFQFYLRIGTFYLRRDLNLQNGILTPSSFGWNPSIDGYEFSPGLVPSPNIQTTISTYQISFTTPVMPTTPGSGQVEFWLEQLGIYKAITGASTSGLTAKWEFFDTYIEVLVDGRPINGSAVIEYSAKNPTDDWGEELEFESLLADRVDVNDLGGLFAGTSTTPSTFWGDFNGGRTLLLANLWCERMVRFRKKPRQRMYTEFYGGYFPVWKRLNDGVKRWVMVAATYTAGIDRIAGEWIELEKSGEVVSVRDPKGKDIDPTHLNGWPGAGLPAPGGDGGTGGNDERVIPGLLYPLAGNYTSAAIMAGAVTAMALKLPTKGGVFIEGDTWVVMDPATGRNFTATVTTTAEEGDTSVDITGTASDIIPAESMILYPLTNLTTIPGGSVRWKRWTGTVSGDELAIPALTNPLPLDTDRIQVSVLGILYDEEVGDPTYTVDVGANTITFSRTELDGLDAVVRIL